MGPGVSQESGETQDGLHVWEDHFLPEIVDPLTLEPVAGRRGGRAGLHQPDQAGDAGDPLPHPRPDPAAAGHGVPRLPADAEGHRPHRRHDDRARGERVPDADRGADPRRRRSRPALHVRADPAGQPRRAHGAGRVAGRRRTADAAARRSRPALAERIKNRIGVTARVEVVAPHAPRAVDRQGPADRGPTRSRPRTRVSPRAGPDWVQRFLPIASVLSLRMQREHLLGPGRVEVDARGR